MKICAFGECLIDFSPQGLSEKGNNLFEQNPGGAPANLAVAVARLGVKSYFVGKVGQDIFGKFLVSTLDHENVDTRGIVYSHRYHTSLAFVQLQENGERDFTFYRNPGADVAIESREVDFDILHECEVFHFGSVSLTHNPARQTTFELLKVVSEHHKIITFDPNVREPLWNDLDSARHQIRKALKYTSILKVTEEELLFVAEMDNVLEAVNWIQREYDIPLILVTRAELGGYAKIKSKWFGFDSFPVNSIDSTGAGDAFFGTFLAGIGRHECVESIKLEDILMMIREANAAGAIATLVKGAIPSLPTLVQLETFLKVRNHEGYCYPINQEV